MQPKNDRPGDRKRHQAGHAPIRNRLSIEERPGIVNLKQRFGDWEMDTIIGGNGKEAVVTLAERTTAFALSEKPPRGRNARELTETVYRMLPPYKDSVHTITVDNGAEFADHQRLARLLDSKIYFTHPYSSREKGLIEYTNKLFRQYIPKKANFDDYNDKQIKEIQYRINSRPRYKLNFYSPKEMFFLNLDKKLHSVVESTKKLYYYFVLFHLILECAADVITIK